jgi:hypothetical protein
VSILQSSTNLAELGCVKHFNQTVTEHEINNFKADFFLKAIRLFSERIILSCHAYTKQWLFKENIPFVAKIVCAIKLLNKSAVLNILE